jgi:predicted  nucleic acid-binding Zn-ribbon protein
MIKEQLSVKEQLSLLARLAAIDTKLEELEDELGELPQEVKQLERAMRAKQSVLDDMRTDLTAAQSDRANARVRIQELHDREAVLSEQQKNVRNNREFDAITREIEAIKAELREQERNIGTYNLTEENLQAQLTEQEKECSDAQELLQAKEDELRKVAEEHDEDTKKLIDSRINLIGELPNDTRALYERIHERFANAAVVMRHPRSGEGNPLYSRGNCSGCFSAVPSQRIQQIRAYSTIFQCEHCSRILFTDENALPDDDE